MPRTALSGRHLVGGVDRARRAVGGLGGPTGLLCDVDIGDLDVPRRGDTGLGVAQRLGGGYYSNTTTARGALRVVRRRGERNIQSPSGYSASITAVSYWNSVAFISTCVPNAPQWITIKVTETLNAKSATNNFIVDDPLARPIVTPGNATQLVYIEQPGNASINTALTPEPVVRLKTPRQYCDHGPLTGHAGHHTRTGTKRRGALVGLLGHRFYGVVTFSSCTINLAGQGYTLTASDGSLSAATSKAFTFRRRGHASWFSTSQPGSSSGGSTLSTQPVVDVEDANGLPVTIGQFNGVACRDAFDGIERRTFLAAPSPRRWRRDVHWLRGDLAGNAYTLTASDGTLTTAISSPFTLRSAPRPSSSSPRSQLGLPLARVSTTHPW